MESRRNKLEEVELKVVPMKSNDKIKEFSKIKVSEVDNEKDKEVLTEKEKLDRACEVWVKKVKEFQGTATRNNGKVEEPTERIFDGIYGEVKKNEDKEVKIEMELLLTYPKLVTVDNTENVRDPEGGQTEIEIEKDGNKVFEIDEEEAWKTEEEEKVKIERKGRIRISSNIEHENGRVDDDNRKADECKTYHNTTSMDNGGTVKDDNDNKTVVEEDEDIAVDIEKRLTEKKRNHAYNELTAKKERKTLAGNDDDKKEEKNAGTEKSLKKETLSRVCEKKRLGLDDVRKMVDDEKEGRESGGLPELDRITIQNIECAKNGEVSAGIRDAEGTIEDGCYYQDELGVRIEEACEWYLKSTEDANSADQFDP
ncbi:9889_t:CDS:2, partial [Gigaspora rosea]